MKSAFGIEHGEFSKARRARQKPPSQARLTLGEAGRKVSSARVSLTDIGTATGKGVSGVGNVLRAKPGLTGAAVVSGAGYSLYRVNNKKKAPKGM